MMALEMLTIVSWITYYIPHDSYPGRLSPLLVVLLAQINILLNIFDDVPSSDTLGPLEIYVLGSIAQVFFVIGSYSYVLIRIQISKNKIVIDLDQEEIIEHQRCQIARKADIICFCSSLVINIVFSLLIFVLTVK